METTTLFVVAVLTALANVPLLLIPPTRQEQHLWRRVGVRRLRRWITRHRNPGSPHQEGGTVAIARKNILWHVGLSLILAALVLHPQVRTGPLRWLRYVLLAGCVAYLVGSIVQRQKIVIASNERTRLDRHG